MRWTSGDRSNIDDQRASTGGMRMGSVGGLGLGGLLIVLLLSWISGVDVLSLLGDPGGRPPSESAGTTGTLATTPEEEKLVDMVDSVLADGQSTWQELLGGRYQDTRATLFRDAIQSACGFAEAATGPFYCPADRKIYLDLGFFNELDQKMGASGDFAQAYVISHELGHHVQTLTGTESQVRRLQSANPGARNELSVRMELQADCYAGVWGHHANKAGGRVDLDPGDVEEGLRAAAAIGDDRLQRMSTGRVMPERFTHGTSQQRAEWLRRGLSSGDPNACNTFQ
jgi:uncharacterized protein